MNNVLKLIAVLFIGSFITSCQKDFENTLDPVIPPVITPHDSVTVLSKIIYIDYRVSDTDTTSYGEYTYDSQQRVTSIKGYFVNSSNPAATEIYSYFYSGNDSLAYKMIYEDKELSTSYADTSYYFYDNLKRLIKDSSVYSGMQMQVAQYTYSAAAITAIYTFTNALNPAENNVYKDTGFIGPTGDVIKTNTLTGHSDPISGYVESYITTFEYNNKPNPFNLLNIRSTYNPVPGFDFYLESFYLQKNNVVSSTSEEPSIPGSASTDTYTYTYNASGLPTSVSVAFGFGQVDDYRILFVYKKI